LIPFNKPYLTGKETHYIYDAVNTGKLSGNGKYTKMCQKYFQTTYGFGKCLLTTSCTDALEMSAILLDIKEGDEVIMPSYTFVSTANAFILRGAKIIFVDSRVDHPGMDESLIEKLITSKTKAIVPVHYAGVACDMDIIMELALQYNLFVIEDAAHSIDSFYIGKNGIKKALGSIGHFGAFSFHETKNLISGEGGMLAINDSRFMERAEIIWEKGTNRSAFFRGEVNKYNWVDIGSSFLPSELTAAFLWAQLESLDKIQTRRLQIWHCYNNNLKLQDRNIRLPFIPDYATNNAHMYYLVLNETVKRDLIIESLKSEGIHAVFHYQSLHKSPFYKDKCMNLKLDNSEKFTNCLLRLPFFYELENKSIKLISELINENFKDI